jgi:hypothetical protein
MVGEVMSKAESKRKALRALIAAGKTTVLPGAHDPLSAKLIERPVSPQPTLEVMRPPRRFSACPTSVC